MTGRTGAVDIVISDHVGIASIKYKDVLAAWERKAGLSDTSCLLSGDPDDHPSCHWNTEYASFSPDLLGTTPRPYAEGWNFSGTTYAQSIKNVRNHPEITSSFFDFLSRGLNGYYKDGVIIEGVRVLDPKEAIHYDEKQPTCAYGLSLRQRLSGMVVFRAAGRIPCSDIRGPPGH